MKVSWQKFDGVEAQVFEPDAGAKAAILFCPGFPGMGATIFEQRHAAAFAEEGYAVYVIKHKGIRIASGHAPVMINNGARLMEAHRNNEKHLGGGIATIEDWLSEPLRLLPLVDKAHDEIHVIGNSFGALSALWSLTEKGAAINKIKSILLYAGAQGVDDGTEDCIMRLWQPEFMMASRITDKVSLNDPFDMVATLKRTYGVLPERVKALPDSIGITYLVVDRDELLNVGDSKAFQAAIGGRGTIVMDKIDHAWPDMGLLAHDTADYRTDDLLGLIRG